MIKMTEHSIDLSQLERVRDGSGHSIFGASGSPMFLNCTGSLIPNLLKPDDAEYDAAYGTVAHGVTEEWLRSGKRPEHLLGTCGIVDTSESWHLIDIDEEMLGYAEECVDRCEWEPGEHLVEYRVDYSHLTPIPNQGGTLDFAAMTPKLAKCKDHKFGSSPSNIVYAEENTQLMLYGVGLDRAFFDKYKFETFVFEILQPRLNHFDEWECSRKRLMEFAEYARVRMAEAWSLDAPRTPGVKQCRFCKVRATCVANARFQEELLDGVFGDTTVQTAEQMREFVTRLDDDLEAFVMRTTNAHDLSTEQMAKLIQFRPMADAWWKALEEELNRRGIVEGQKIPGMKKVEGRTFRQFKNQSVAEAELIRFGLKREELYKETFVSPAQAEDLLAKKYKRKDIPVLMKGLAYKPPGKVTLVPLSDPRPEVEDVLSSVFGDTTQTNRQTDTSSNPESEEL